MFNSNPFNSMKSIKNIIMSTAVFATAGLGLTSCDIDMLPLNEVVLENFWTDRNDVESVVNSCYDAVLSDTYMEDLVVWGECRSDNVSEGSQVPEALKYLLKGSIKTTSTYCNWSAMYNVINRCNTVLQYAPIVAEKDPNYDVSLMNINIAECKFLRAFSYLTLIKTYKNVPFTFEASIDDTQDYFLPQTPFNTILDSLIVDIESCKNFAPVRHGIKSDKNCGRVTRAAMYSLLAELYLWRASDAELSDASQDEYYRKCIDACDYVLAYKIKQYKDDNFEDERISKDIDKEVYGEYGYPLLAEELTVGQNEGGPKAFNKIFGEGGSFETIFELKFRTGSYSRANNIIDKYYGTSLQEQYLLANEKLMESKPKDGAQYSDDQLFSVPSDYRSIAPFYYKEDASDYNIYKYTVENNLAGDKKEKHGSVGSVFSAGTQGQKFRSNQANWIIYRLTEIMLFRAEAEIELANHIAAQTPEEDTDATEGEASGNGAKRRKIASYVPGNTLTTAEALNQDAFNIISAVYRRSNPEVKTKPKFAPSLPENIDAFRKLLLNERRREFLFEAKRFYDLVRFTRRLGDTKILVNALSAKYGEGGAAVTIKMTNPEFMYMPVSYGEMKVNPNLIQNECYLDEIENIKN